MGKHTIPGNEWFNYPVLAANQFEEIVLLQKKGVVCLIVRVGKQDGFWVKGYELQVGGTTVGSFGKGCNPSRKWGEYATRTAAIIAAIDDMLNACMYMQLTRSAKHPMLATCIKTLQLKKQEVKGKQLQLFT